MKLLTLLNVVDDAELVRVFDDNATVETPPLFIGKVKDCKLHRSLRNGVVKLITPDSRLPALLIHIDIEYQKKRALKEERKHETIQHRTGK